MIVITFSPGPQHTVAAGGDDLIAIDPEDWPKLRVLLEVFYGVGERDGLNAAAAWLTRNDIGWSWATPAPRLPRPPRPPQRAPRPPRPSGYEVSA
jgi:hypothetical protein